jgi:hypothetical protein
VLERGSQASQRANASGPRSLAKRRRDSLALQRRIHMALPTKTEILERTIVEALAEDVAVHGWKVSDYTVRENIDKMERTLSIVMHRSTNPDAQAEMDLKGEKPARRRGRRAAEPSGE